MIPDTIWIVIGALAVLVGLWLVVVGRGRLRRANEALESGPESAAADSMSGEETSGWGSGLSGMTVMVIGLALAGGGYHLAVWQLPGSLNLLAAPRDRWAIVVGVMVAAVAISLATDAVDRKQR